MNNYENDNQIDDSNCSTFYIDNLPETIKLGHLPDTIQNWIETQGFDFVVLCTKSSEILYASASVKKILNYTSADLIKEKALDYLAPSDKQALMENFNLKRKKPQKAVVSVRDLLGKYVWIDAAIASLYISKANKKVYVVLAKDITDKKEAEEMLIRSEKMSVAGQLAAGVAHEIRNPLTALKGFVQLLQAGIEQKEAYYQIMIDEIEKIDTITSELLFIAKPMTDNRKHEDLSKMLNEVVTLLKTQAKRFEIKIEVTVEESISLYCDRTQIKQVFINLIKNAIEAMVDGGTIFIDTTHDDHYGYITFMDQGTGIPKHLIHKLKEPFFTTKKDGTGLGLMISNKIVENHQGKMKIQSEEGVGSTFTLVLPRHSEI